MNRLKLAELTSGVGALVPGVGLGALFPRWFGAAAGLITVAARSRFFAANRPRAVRQHAIPALRDRNGEPK